jgi:hypothetical protein
LCNVEAAHYADIVRAGVPSAARFLVVEIRIDSADI